MGFSLVFAAVVELLIVWLSLRFFGVFDTAH
jgi:hypothetical protein